MSLLTTIQTDMVIALKARDEARLSALRMLKTALDRRVKDGGKPLDEQAEQQVLETQAKQRRDSIDMFTKGNRLDLAAKEQAELALIESYLPAMASAGDVDAAIASAIADLRSVSGAAYLPGMGVVMKMVKTKLVGKRVDGKLVSDQVKAALGK